MIQMIITMMYIFNGILIIPFFTWMKEFFILKAIYIYIYDFEIIDTKNFKLNSIFWTSTSYFSNESLSAIWNISAMQKTYPWGVINLYITGNSKFHMGQVSTLHAHDSIWFHQNRVLLSKLNKQLQPKFSVLLIHHAGVIK